MSEKLFCFGISGGKDSTALLLWAIHRSGYPRESLRFVFADTKNEHPELYAYVDLLDTYVQKHGCPPIVRLQPQFGFYELALHRHRFPSAVARFCTEELKLIPSKNYYEGLVTEGFEVLIHTGVRASESDARALYKDRALDSYTGMPVYRPLLNWTIDDVWAIHKEFGVPRNPLYDMGLKRVGCLPCVMSRKSEMAIIAEKFPERFDQIREVENAFENENGFSGMYHRSAIPFRFRSRRITTKGEGGKTFKLEGLFLNEEIEKFPIPPREMMVASIDDVRRWATETTEKSLSLFEEEEDLEKHSYGTCNHESGACE